MTGNVTGNTPAFIHAQQYSAFISANLPEHLLPEQFYRNVTDFGQGTTLNIKSVGAVTLQELAEDQAIEYRDIESGTINLTINNFKGAGWAISDKLREDGTQIETLESMHAQDAIRQIAAAFETDYLQALYAAQTDADANLVNNFAHRITGSNSEAIALADLIGMQVAFDKANIPVAGRIGIVDPVVAAQLNSLATTTIGIDRNPQFQMQLERGFQGDHRFIMNMFGFDIYVSNLLPDVDGASDGTTALAGAGKANIFMSVLDDGIKPGMCAWRRPPKAEGDRDMDDERDKFKVSARYGCGVQRVDSLGVILTKATV